MALSDQAATQIRESTYWATRAVIVARSEKLVQSLEPTIDEAISEHETELGRMEGRGFSPSDIGTTVPISKEAVKETDLQEFDGPTMRKAVYDALSGAYSKWTVELSDGYLHCWGVVHLSRDTS